MSQAESKRRSYLRSRLRSFRFAASGLWRLLREEPNARLHLVAALLAVILGIFVRLTRLEWAVIALAIFGVFSAEALNSALERLADVVSPDHQPMIGAAKDLAAAAVLLVSLGALIVGSLLFCRRLFG